MVKYRKLNNSDDINITTEKNEEDYFNIVIDNKIELFIKKSKVENSDNFGYSVSMYKYRSPKDIENSEDDTDDDFIGGINY